MLFRHSEGIWLFNERFVYIVQGKLSTEVVQRNLLSFYVQAEVMLSEVVHHMGFLITLRKSYP